MTSKNETNYRKPTEKAKKKASKKHIEGIAENHIDATEKLKTCIEKPVKNTCKKKSKGKKQLHKQRKLRRIKENS